MPTTQPLDEDELGDILGGPLKSIAGFAQPNITPSGEAPRASVPKPAVAKPSASKTEVPSTPTVRKFKDLRSPSLSLNGNRAAPVKDTKSSSSQPAQSTVSRSAPYKPSDVEAAWNLFIDRNGAEYLLVNAMRMASPVHVSDNTFRIAQSNIHLGYIREHLQRLTKYVRDSVNNDNVVFELQEVSEDSPLAWNDRELIRHIIENNPDVGQFLTDLDLHIL